MTTNQEARAFVDRLAKAIADHQVAAVVIESELEPVTGPGAVIQPPTYLASSSDPASKYARFEGFMPQADDDGWFRHTQRDEHGRPVAVPAVVIDSLGSQANRCEEALWGARELVGGLPGVEISATPVTVEQVEDILRKKKLPTSSAADIQQLVATAQISSWQTSHRHVDAHIRYAQEPGADRAAWVSEGGLRDLIAGANSTRDASSAFGNFPNSLLFGFWLSSGTVERHRQARVYSSEVIGYNAQAARSGASKYDDLPVSNKVALAASEDGFTATPKASVAKKDRPSAWGFGMVPGEVEVHGFSCELILRRASVSFAALRAMRYGEHGQPKTHAAGVVLTCLALLGHHLSALDSHLRSGCELITVETRLGLRRLGHRAPEGLSISMTTDTLVDAVRVALADAAQVGLTFASPILATMSTSEVHQLVLSAAQALASGAEGAEE
ncbi:type I-U CRISPR-associated protein Cas7 [Cellulomonas sp. NPDC089187]|uniref:type I-G CRISPR-associated protein Cas7 n=1 Tax=Cellulomonas sp. NPDC089187 TaxID=3154970 RepID=UPI003438CF60